MKHRPFPVIPALLLAGATVLTPAAALFGSDTAEPASVAAFSKNGLSTEEIPFSAEDFQVSGDGTLSSIVLTSLPDPAAGILTIGGQSVPEGSEISMAAIDGLRFTPLSSPMLAATAFTFSPIFSDGEVGEDVTVGLYLLSSANGAPVAANLSLTTYKNVEISGTFAGVHAVFKTILYEKSSRGKPFCTSHERKK